MRRKTENKLYKVLRSASDWDDVFRLSPQIFGRNYANVAYRSKTEGLRCVTGYPRSTGKENV